MVSHECLLRALQLQSGAGASERAGEMVGVSALAQTELVDSGDAGVLPET